MQAVLSTVLVDVPHAAVIWLVLLGVAAAVVGLIVRPELFHSATGGRIREAVVPSELDRADEERERTRYAEEIAVAAERAAATAHRRRTEWLAAQEAVETAWTAYEAAEADVRRLAAAAAMPLPRTVRTPAEYADRERYLHRAAREAYGRRELSVEQLGDVFAHRNGWDPRRHPVEQELVLRRAVRDNLLARHRAAEEAERAAWRAAELAVAAARSLRDEAFTATGRSPEAASLLPLPAEPTRVDASRADVTPPNVARPDVARGQTAVPAY